MERLNDFTTPNRTRSPSTGRARRTSTPLGDSIKLGSPGSPTTPGSTPGSPLIGILSSPGGSDDGDESSYKQAHDAAVMSAVLMDHHAELQSQYEELKQENNDLRLRMSQLEKSRAEHDRLSTQVSLLEAQLHGAQQSQAMLEGDLASKGRLIEELKQQLASSAGGANSRDFAALLEQREQYAGWLEGAKTMIEKMRGQIEGLQGQNKALLDEAKFNQQQADEVPKLQTEIVELKKNNRHLKERLEALEGSPRLGRRGSEPTKPQAGMHQRLDPIVRASGANVPGLPEDLLIVQSSASDLKRFEEALQSGEATTKLTTLLLDHVKSHLLSVSQIDDGSVLTLAIVIAQKLVQTIALLEKANAEIKFLQETEKETKEDLNRKNAAKIQHHVNMYNALAKEMDAMSQQLEAAKSRIQELETSSPQQQKMFSSLESECKSLKEELEAHSSQWQNEREALRTELDSRASECAALKEQLTSRSAELESMTAERDALRGERDARATECVALKEQIDAQSHEFNTRISNLDKELVQMRQDLSESDQVVQELKVQLSAANSEKLELNTKLSKHEAESTNLTAELAQLKSALDSAAAENGDKLAQLEKELENSQQLNTSLQQQLSEAHAKVADLETLVKQEQAQMEQLQAKFANAAQTDSESKQQLERDLSQHKESLAELKEQLKQLSDSKTSEIDQLQQQLSQYMTDVAVVRDQLVESQRKYDALLAEQSEAGILAEKLKSEVQQQESAVNRLKELLDHKDSQNESQHEIIENLNRQIHEMTTMDAERDRQLAALNEQLLAARATQGGLFAAAEEARDRDRDSEISNNNKATSVAGRLFSFAGRRFAPSPPASPSKSSSPAKTSISTQLSSSPSAPPPPPPSQAAPPQQMPHLDSNVDVDDNDDDDGEAAVVGEISDASPSPSVAATASMSPSPSPSSPQPAPTILSSHWWSQIFT